MSLTKQIETNNKQQTNKQTNIFNMATFMALRIIKSVVKGGLEHNANRADAKASKEQDMYYQQQQQQQQPQQNAPRQQMFAVKVPKGIRPGMKFNVPVQGKSYTVKCPSGVRPGQTIHVPILLKHPQQDYQQQDMCYQQQQPQQPQQFQHNQYNQPQHQYQPYQQQQHQQQSFEQHYQNTAPETPIAVAIEM